jgi:hypothetical protein
MRKGEALNNRRGLPVTKNLFWSWEIPETIVFYAIPSKREA